MAFRNLEDGNEEFNNFMHRVTEISSIVKKLTSNDVKTREIGTLEADKYIANEKSTVYENIDEDTIKLTVKSNKTLINNTALMSTTMDQNTMSQEAFMTEVSKDADKRFKDKKIRKERAETLKKRGANAFRRGEYEKAVTCYTKAIEQIKDSPLLYNNRALAYINLGFHDKAIEDAEKSLRLNEKSLKAGLLMAKAYFLKGDVGKYDDAVKEVRERNGDKADFINEYVEELEKKKMEKLEKEGQQ